MSRISINRLSPEQWKIVSEATHAVVFKEVRKPYMDRIDFALIAHDDEENVPWGYMTVRELDKETVYWQYGGSFPSIKGTINTAKCYEEYLKWHRVMEYKQVVTLVETENIPYLKLAMHYGFRINGVRMFKGEVLVELLNDLTKEK